MKKQPPKKRRKKRVKPLTKKQKLVYVFHRNKPLFFLFSFLFSLLVIIGSTYAWYTYSDERLNRTEENTGTFDVRLVGDFSPVLAFAPGESLDKQLQVENVGESPAFVRLSLYEFFLSFEINLEDGQDAGNGGLKEIDTPSKQEIELTDNTTWKKGNTYEVEKDKYYQASEVFTSDIADSSTAYVYQGNPVYPALAYRSIIFNTSNITTSIPNDGTIGYWYYNEGYFYYSNVIEPGEKTELLIDGMNVKSTLPNQYKGAIYQLCSVLDAHDISSSLINDWSLNGTAMETIYQNKLK